MRLHSPTIRPDFTVSSATGEEQLLVEVKNWTSTSAKADKQRRTLIAQRRMFGHPECYFLLVTPSHMALWLPAEDEQLIAISAYEMKSALVLANYLTIERHPLQTLTEQDFSLVISSWLGSVMFKPESTLLEMPGQAWLVESGLHARIYRGYIHREQLMAS